MGKAKVNPEYYRKVFELHNERKGIDRATTAFSLVFDKIGVGIDKLLKILDDEKATNSGNNRRMGG